MRSTGFRNEPQRHERLGGGASRQPNATTHTRNTTSSAPDSGDTQSTSLPPAVASTTSAASAAVTSGEPEVVDRVLHPTLREVQARPQDGGCDDRERQVDEERPAPAEVVDEQPAEGRTDDDGRREGHALVAEPATQLAGWHEIAEDRHAEHGEATPADPLNRARHEELRHRLRQAARIEPRTNSPITNSSTSFRP